MLKNKDIKYKLTKEKGNKYIFSAEILLKSSYRMDSGSLIKDLTEQKIKNHLSTEIFEAVYGEIKIDLIKGINKLNKMMEPNSIRDFEYILEKINDITRKSS